MKDLISVIVPIYNVEKYLKKCLDSIINQTYNNLEIILVDDGSPDNCGKICDEYAKKDNRIKVIHKENGGVSSARNKGLDIANGEYVFFIDSDDYIELDAIEKLLSMGKSDFIISKGYRIEKNERIAIDNDILKSETINNPEYKEKIFSKLLLGKVTSGPFAKMYKRNVIEKNKLRFNEELEFGEDTIFTFCFINYSSSFSNVNEYTYNYVTDLNSITQKYSKKTFKRVDNLVKNFKNILLPMLESKHQNEYYFYIVYLLNHLCIEYIFNEQTNLKPKEQKKLLKNLMEKEEYAEAVKNVKINKLTPRKKVMVFLMRMKLYCMIKYVYLFKKIKK